MNYSTYVAMVRELLTQNQTTGIYVSDTFWVNITKRNLDRMDFLIESVELEERIVKKLEAYQIPLTWLVITEAWCIDSPESLVIVHKMAMLNPDIHLKIVLRDKPPNIIDNFLTNESRSIPKIICLDTESLVVLGTWGPRPVELQAKYMLRAMILNSVSRNGKEQIEDQKKLINDVRAWYSAIPSYDIQREIIASLLF